MPETTTTRPRRRPKFITNEKGRRTAVILDIESYKRLMRIQEDREDNRLINETLGKETFPLEDVIAELDLERKKEPIHVR